MSNGLIPYQQRYTNAPAIVPSIDHTAVQSWLRSKHSPHTRKAYGRDITEFYSRVGKSIAEVKLPDLQDYEDWLRIRHPDIATQRRMLYAVKSLLTFAQKQGYIKFNVGTGLEPPKGKKKDCKPNGESGQITVFGKERETRAILLHQKAWKELQTIREVDAEPDDYVFSSRQTSIREALPSRRLSESRVWQIVTSIADKTGVHASPHFFRHAHATQAMKKTSQRIIQQTLGWKSPLTMMKYQHVMPEESSSLVLDL